MAKAVNKNNKDNVSEAKPKITGSVFKAPKDTAAPVSADAELTEAFKCCGYISEDGITFNKSESSETVKAWGGIVVKHLDGDFEDGFKLKYIEALNEEVLKEYYGETAVTGTLDTGITIDVAPNKQDYKMMVIDMLMNKGTVLKRIVIPRCKVTKTSDVTYVDNKTIEYEVEYSCEEGFDDGTYHKEYIKKVGTE